MWASCGVGHVGQLWRWPCGPVVEALCATGALVVTGTCPIVTSTGRGVGVQQGLYPAVGSVTAYRARLSPASDYMLGPSCASTAHVCLLQVARWVRCCCPVVEHSSTSLQCCITLVWASHVSLWCISLFVADQPALALRTHSSHSGLVVLRALAAHQGTQRPPTCCRCRCGVIPGGFVVGRSTLLHTRL
jgi:hypothetical protein